MSADDPTAANPYHDITLLEQRLPALRKALARVRPLLPPQVEDGEILAHLVLYLARTWSPRQTDEDTVEALWKHALAWLARHPAVLMAARELGLEARVASGDFEALRQACLTLALFDTRLPGQTTFDNETLCEAIAALRSDNRLEAALYYLEGMNLPTIGRLLDLPPDEVTALHRETRNHLRRAVAWLIAVRRAA